MTPPLRQLSDEGVAIWLDDMSRGRLVSGSLKALVRDKHVVGVTTNPTIFHKAIAGSGTCQPSWGMFFRDSLSWSGRSVRAC